MPRTKKRAGKRTGKSPQNPTISYRTFNTDADRLRYELHISERALYVEKGFLFQNTPTLGYQEFVHSVVKKHKWEKFCAQPADAVIPVVREFYAHFTESGQSSVYVRGIQVPIDEDSINQVYELGDAEDLHQEYVANAPAEWVEWALERVCVPGTQWTVSAQGKLTVPRASLTPQCKVWYHFLKTRLMPSTHLQTVSKARVLLLDSIITGRETDVGKIIFQSLSGCAAKKCGSLWFPSLITSLCARSGVPMLDGEERLSGASGAITRHTIARLLQEKMGPSHPRDDEEEVPQAPENAAAAASSSQGPTQAGVLNSLQMLEQRMSLAEVQQYQTMEMLQQMHAQQQKFWDYAKQRDLALKKSFQKNFSRPLFPFPEFPDVVLEPVIAEALGDEEEEAEADD